MSTTPDNLTDRERFFYDHAGWSYNPASETSEDGRVREARELARAEEVAARRGWYVDTFYDYDDGADPDDDGETTAAIERGELLRLIVLLRDENGRTMASLGSVIVENGSGDEVAGGYVRVVAAELAAELLATHQECRARVTCGGCGNAWCERCDPAPSALCHWCHGRGESTAPMEPASEEEEAR